MKKKKATDHAHDDDLLSRVLLPGPRYRVGCAEERPVWNITEP